MNNIMDSYDEDMFIEGGGYTVGISDGTQFNNIIYVGKKLLNGKPILTFRTMKGDKQLTVNPSYHSFTLETLEVEEQTQKEERNTNESNNNEG